MPDRSDGAACNAGRVNLPSPAPRNHPIEESIMKMCRQLVPYAGLIAGFAFVLFAATNGRAELNTTRLSPDGRQGHQLLKKVCSRCHYLDWALTAIETEKGQLTGQPFLYKDFKQKLTRLYRQSLLTSEEAKTILVFYQEVAASRNKGVLSEGAGGNEVVMK
jgi:hypothetical protein